MIKYYRSKSCVSISVVFENGSRKHIAFEAKTGGGSTYTTDNEDEQKAIESHPYFNKMFREFVPPIVVESKMKASAPVKKKVDFTSVTVSDIVEAKNYIADRFGVSRTKLKSKKSILEAAAAYKIRFEGIDEEED